MLEQIVFDTTPNIGEHLIIVMDEPTLQENLSEPIQTKNRQFITAVTSLTGYTGIFKKTISNNKFYFTITINDDDFCDVTNFPGAYEIKSLDKETEKILIVERHCNEVNYLFLIKTTFSTLRSFIEISPSRGIRISVIHDDSIRNFVG